MTNDEIFIKYLSEFETVLNRFGYYIHEKEGQKYTTSNSMHYKDLEGNYVNRFIQQRIYLAYMDWFDGGFSVGLRMYKIPSDKTSFDLGRFLKKHQLENKISRTLPEGGGDFETLIKKYFEDLAVLFENELNDQITGKNFENHWQEEMDEFNNLYP